MEWETAIGTAAYLLNFKYRKQNWFMDDQMTKIGVYWLFCNLKKEEASLLKWYFVTKIVLAYCEKKMF